MLTLETTVHKNNFSSDYADGGYFDEEYISTTAWSKMMIIDYAASTDYQDHLKNCFIMTTLTTLIYCLFQLYVKNNFIRDYTDCVVMKDYW